MPNYPVAYYGQDSTTQGSSGGTTDKVLNVPAFPATGVNFLLTAVVNGFGHGGIDAFRDSDGTADTDWTLVATGDNVNSVGYLYYYADPPNSSNWSGRELHMIANDVRLGFYSVQVWENVNQTPSCDSIVSTGSTSAHAPFSVNSMMFSWGYSLQSNDQAYTFGAWDTDATLLYNQLTETGTSSDDQHSYHGLSYNNPPSSGSSDYLLTVSAGGSGNEYRGTAEILAYEIELQSVAGTVTFDQSMGKKTLKGLDGTISFLKELVLDTRRFFTKFTGTLLAGVLGSSGNDKIFIVPVAYLTGSDSVVTPSATIDLPYEGRST
jgi:hypothetical protein